MEPISLILAALLAGATKGHGEKASSALADAYAQLRSVLRNKLTTRPAAEAAIEAYTADPQNAGPALVDHLRRSGADTDAEIVAAAESVMEEADPDGARAGKYTVERNSLGPNSR
jgi:NAD(P)-dependent dehydrogenase (short-subunit alcohol dehydrogenase family)